MDAAIATVGEEIVQRMQLNDNTAAIEGLDKDGEEMVQRMRLNDNKAGMEGLDKDRINQIIHEASKGSKFYENERVKEEQMKKRIVEQKRKVETITEAQLQQGLVMADQVLSDLEQQRDLSRTIVHIDMDAFYAAVEMKDSPELTDKPMAVGGNSMLSTSNYHARKYGVRAAMPGFIARKLCPDLIIVPLNFDKYTAVSKLVREIFADYDPNFCPMSLDEAYLDITDHLTHRKNLSVSQRSCICRDVDKTDSRVLCCCDLNDVVRKYGFNEISQADKKNLKLSAFFADVDIENTPPTFKEKEVELTCAANDRPEMVVDGTTVNQESRTVDGREATPVCPNCKKEFPPFTLRTFGLSDQDAVQELRTRIEQKTQLTASAGLAPNMMLAKVCSDKNKPNGQYKIPSSKQHVMDFIRDLPTRKISGIGKVSEAMLNAVDVYTCTQLFERRALLYHLYSSISFNYFMRICLGIGSTAVERDSERKSMSTERTFSEMNKPAELYQKCEELSDCLALDLQQQQLKGKTVSIKIKTVKFEVKTRAQTLREHSNDKETISRAARDLLRTEIQLVAPFPLRLRLMGVRMSSLLHENMCKKQNTIIGAFKKASEKSGTKVNNNNNRDTVGEPGLIANDTLQTVDSVGQDMNHMTDDKTICNSGVAAVSDVDGTEKCSHPDEDVVSDCNLKVKEHVLSFCRNSIECITPVKALKHGTENESRDCDIEVSEPLPISGGHKLEVRQNRSGFVRTPVSVKRRRGRNAKVQQMITYDCPICDRQVSCASLAEFNDHVDQCLETQADVGSREELTDTTETSVQTVTHTPETPSAPSKQSSDLCREELNGKTETSAQNATHTPETPSAPSKQANDPCREEMNVKTETCVQNVTHKLEVPSAFSKKSNNLCPVDKADCGSEGPPDCTQQSDQDACKLQIHGSTVEAQTEVLNQDKCVEGSQDCGDNIHGSVDDKHDQRSSAVTSGEGETDQALVMTNSDLGVMVDGSTHIHVDDRNVTLESNTMEYEMSECKIGTDLKVNDHCLIRHAADECVTNPDSHLTCKPVEQLACGMNGEKTVTKEISLEKDFVLDSESCHSEEVTNKDTTTDSSETSRGDSNTPCSNEVCESSENDTVLHDTVCQDDTCPSEEAESTNSHILNDNTESGRVIQKVDQSCNASKQFAVNGGVSVATDYDDEGLSNMKSDKANNADMFVSTSGCSKTNNSSGITDKNANKIAPDDEYAYPGTSRGHELVIEDFDCVPSTSDCSESLLVCPICNIEQRAVSLTEFNIHVDMCLSRGTIKEILKEQRTSQQATLKRSSAFSQSPGMSQNVKRRKTAIPSKKAPCRSIASFFAEK